jgi:pseudouridine-5'-phosphate glycosidase
MPDWLQIAAEVRDARAVVALESTIIAHGMPYPENLSTARTLEQRVREGGAVPATIAVMDGAVRVGLSEGELETLAKTQGVLKLSRADLPYAVASGKTGATTVAATMICAHLAGIRVFATGGIGGVHRGAETSFDISADLDELARTPVAVVSAGAKALLDLPKTLEYLETRGVPVIGYGTEEFPAFWSRLSGWKTPLRMDTVQEIARFLAVKWEMGLAGGAVVCNPVPAAAEIPAEQMRGFIEAALHAAKARGVSGKAVTPFILARIAEFTNGRSLRTNIALAESNARLAAEIACAGIPWPERAPLP